MPNDVNGNLLIEQGAFPQYTEATRTGNGWYFQSIVTGMTNTAAVPTVGGASNIQEIYNNLPGMVMVIDTLHAFQLLGTAATQTYSIWAMVTTQKAAPTNSAQTIFSNSGRSSYATVAGGRILTPAIGTTVVANGWRPFGSVQAWGTAAATPGNGWHVEVNGRLLVPYGTSLCLAMAGSLATASSAVLGVSWYEVGTAVGSAGNLAMVV